jgi:acetyl-CoA carboxylase carboxyl transferase subunit beta
MTQTAVRSWAELKPARRGPTIPEGLWLRCPGCTQMIYRRAMEANLHTCPECTHHFRIGATERVRRPSKPRADAQTRWSRGEAFVKGRPAMLACLDLSFMMGSMGCVVGETLTRERSSTRPLRSSRW